MRLPLFVLAARWRMRRIQSLKLLRFQCQRERDGVLLYMRHLRLLPGQKKTFDRRRYASDVTKHVPICSCCGRVAAASDPICIECRRVQHMLVAWGLMRADETGPPKSRKLVCRAASAGPRSAAKLLTKDEVRSFAAANLSMLSGFGRPKIPNG